MRRGFAAVAVAVAASLLTASCSGGDGRDGGEGGAGTSSTTASTTTTTAPMTDKQRAESIVLKEADAGAGFHRGAADEETSARSPLYYDDCAKGTLLDTKDDSRSAESDLAKDQNTSVLTAVSLATDEAAMQPAFDHLNSDRYLDCFGQYDKFITGKVAEADGGELSDWRVEKKTVTAAAGVDVFAIETVSVVTGGFKATWHHEVVFVRKGRALAALVFFTDGAPYPQAEQDRLTALLIDRMGAA